MEKHKETHDTDKNTDKPKCTTHHHACDCREWEFSKRIAELTAECDRLQAMVITFCKQQTWTAKAWRDQAHVKPLFEYAALLREE